jgi:ribosomal-protein-alanine N-acetyltransferase
MASLWWDPSGWPLPWWPAVPPPLIDAAAPADAPALAEIHAACFARGWSEAELEALVADPAVDAQVARRASPFGTRRPVGFALCRRAGDEAEVLTIAVSPRWRGRGVATELTETLLRRLYADRVGAVFLEVDAGNVPALALYRRLRFRQVGERRGYYAGSGGGHALVMRCDLR